MTIIFTVPIIEPDFTIQCVSAPCKVPNWTIYEWYINTQTVPESVIDTFDECVEATGTVQNSFPRQCKYNGQIFVE